MTKTILVEQPGGPEAMKFIDVELAAPAAGEVRIRQTAIGVDFVDVHQRRGSYPMPMPLTPGYDAAGVVESIGPGVTSLKPGDRVAYANSYLQPGAYTEARLYPAERLVKLPAGISDREAAAMLFRGLTVQGLIRTAFVVEPKHRILVHAAAGGVGSMLTAWAKHLGATVIGTVSTKAKAAQAQRQGCDHVIVLDSEDFVESVAKYTKGQGVNVVYDGVGQDTIMKSFSCLARYGVMVSFGQASGPIAPIDIAMLATNCLYVTKYSVKSYCVDPKEYQTRCQDVLAAIEQGIFARDNFNVFPLAEAARAHQELEGRRSTGVFVLET